MASFYRKDETYSKLVARSSLMYLRVLTHFKCLYLSHCSLPVLECWCKIPLVGNAEAAGELLRVGDSNITGVVIIFSQLDPLERLVGLPHMHSSDYLDPGKIGGPDRMLCGCRLCRGKQKVDQWTLDEISSQIRSE